MFYFTRIGYTAGILFLTSVIAGAQVRASSLQDSLAASQWRVQLEYTSDVPYLGRADSARVPYLSPSLAYYHKSGLFGTGMVSFLVSGGEKRLDRAVFSAGYTYFRDRFAAGVKASGYLYDDESYAIDAEISGAVSVHAEASLSVVSLYAEAGAGFSRGTDFFTGIEINRSLYLLRYRLKVTPLVYVSAGTQHYYDAYMTYRSTRTGAGNGKGKGGNTTPPLVITKVADADVFQLRDFEASVLLSYFLGDVRILGSATVIVPVNPAEVISDQGVFVEDQGTLFVWSLGARFTLR